MKLLIILSITAMTSIVFLGACGVKPSKMEKPVGKEDVVYPKTYPNPDSLEH